MAEKFYYHSLGITTTEGSISGSTFSASDITRFPTRTTDYSIVTATNFKGQDESKALRFENPDGLDIRSLVVHIAKSYELIGTITLYASSNALTGYSSLGTLQMETWSILEISADTSAYFLVDFSGFYDIDVSKIMVGDYWNPVSYSLNDTLQFNPGSDVKTSHSGVSQSSKRSELGLEFHLPWEFLSATEKTDLQTLLTNRDGKFLFYHTRETTTRFREEYHWVDFVSIPVFTKTAHLAYSTDLHLKSLDSNYSEISVTGYDPDDPPDPEDPKDPDFPEPDPDDPDPTHPFPGIKIEGILRGLEAMDKNRFIVAYGRQSPLGNHHGRVVIGTVNDTGMMTLGTTIAFNDTITVIQAIQIAPDKIAIAYRHTVNREMMSVVGIVSNDTDIALGTPVIIDDDFTWGVPANGMEIVKGVDDEFIVYYGRGGNNAEQYHTACSVNGDVITVGSRDTTPASVRGDPDTPGNHGWIDVARIDDTYHMGFAATGESVYIIVNGEEEWIYPVFGVWVGNQDGTDTTSGSWMPQEQPGYPTLAVPNFGRMDLIEAKHIDNPIRAIAYTLLAWGSDRTTKLLFGIGTGVPNSTLFSYGIYMPIAINQAVARIDIGGFTGYADIIPWDLAEIRKGVFLLTYVNFTGANSIRIRIIQVSGGVIHIGKEFIAVDPSKEDRVIVDIHTTIQACSLGDNKALFGYTDRSGNDAQVYIKMVKVTGDEPIAPFPDYYNDYTFAKIPLKFKEITKTFSELFPTETREIV